MLTVLTIAGFDPSSGAGITADLAVFAAHGLFGTSCITGLTVQSTRGVVSNHPVAPDIIGATLNCLLEDLPPAGIKIGMLSSAAAAASVADFLTRIRPQFPHIPVILDPVLASSSGMELIDPTGADIIRRRLLPLVNWVTPNLDELAILTGLTVASKADLPTAALALQKLVAASDNGRGLNILATGGHLDPPDDLLLTSNGDAAWIPGQHIVSISTHGTGCALSSALLSRLLLGDQPHQAATAAKLYVAEAIRTAIPRGSGNGPLNHLWPLRPSKT